jgi:FtsZ-interacting cell division protein ZipA
MPKASKSMLSADETRAMQARKKAEKEEQAKKEAAKKQKEAEKAERDRRQAAKKAEMAAAKAKKAKPPAGNSKEQELMKKVKEGEKHEQGAGADYEVALECYREAMAGFAAMGAERPKLLEKITKIESMIEEEAAC